MKTLFIQTHELAKKLDPNIYTCVQLRIILYSKYSINYRSFNASTSMRFRLGTSELMKTLYLELPLTRRWSLSKKEFFELSDILVPEGYAMQCFDTKSKDMYFSFNGARSIRQRLINSLLTRPDRTLCVLIPE